MDETKDLHSAEKPHQLTWQGWKQIGKRVKSQLTVDHISIVSAGVAFYFFLSLFPTLIAAISIFGLVMEPAEIQQQISEVAHILPDQSSEMISNILEGITEKSSKSLGWSLVWSILFSLFTAMQGTKAVFEGINVAYDEIDERGFFKYNGLTLLFTLGGILIGIISAALVIVFPAIIQSIDIPASGVEKIIPWLRWPVLALIVMGVLAITYKIAPDRRNPQFSWVSWGAVIATVLWVAGSGLFSFYISNFGTYDKMYGSFSAVIILMLWFYITAYVTLLGAEINSEMEHQTRKDSTIGKDRPMGQRNAYHADHVAD
ncbi:MAG TPA: YihY/virulence factor BrkB family protein [Gracilimonas sp.]|uniref:YihY/virulence factor BrkB family protein n=1 Tax=Gracilimonas sp. TaxID=1974203 RepID=UPI002DA68299|nr:YihY/virulence factor BrkB family protein [Gracilimonas sp.]